VYEAILKTGAPAEIALTSALAATSLACQGLIDVEPPSGPARRPVSLIFLTVADSGSRKTTVDDLFFESIVAFERDAIRVREREVEQQNVELSNWAIKQKTLNSKLRRQISKGGPENPELLEAIRAHKLSQPTPLPHAQILFTDVTPNTLAIRLAESEGSAILHSSDAGFVVNSQTLNNPNLLCTLWDGKDVHLDRLDRRRSAILSQPRLTISFMMQALPFSQLCKRGDGIARQSGLFARALICKPSSIAGTRFITPGMQIDTRNLTEFNQRVLALLNVKDTSVQTSRIPA